MLKGLVERFGRRGATDHLRSGWRRVQEELDLRELFVLTSSHARDVPVDDDAALIDVLSEEQRGLTYDEVKAEVTKNLTANLHTMCGGEGRAEGDQRRRARLAGRRHRRVPQARRILRSRRRVHGAERGRGLFVNGQVDPGEIVCVYPGVVYAAENLRHMPGYPKIATDNPYLVARYDGSVVDAAPWGLGAGWSAKTRKNGDGWTDGERRGVEGFGRWPGAPIGTDGDGVRKAAKGAAMEATVRRLAPRRGWRDWIRPSSRRQGRGRRGGQAAPARARAPRQPPAQRSVAQRRRGIRRRRL